MMNVRKPLLMRMITVVRCFIPQLVKEASSLIEEKKAAKIILHCTTRENKRRNRAQRGLR